MGISLSLTSTISIYQANLRLISKFLPLLWWHVNLNINFITKLSCTISFIRHFFKLEQNNNKLLICIFVHQKKLILLYPSYGLNDSPPPIITNLYVGDLSPKLISSWYWEVGFWGGVGVPHGKRLVAL